MSKSIKIKNNTYIDSTGVTHKKSLLSTLLDNITNSTKTLSDSITKINNSITSINNSINSIDKINFKNANTEYQTGEYFLGKPVYMYTITGNGNNQKGVINRHIITSLNNVEWIIRIEGSAWIQNSQFIRVFNSTYSSGTDTQLNAYVLQVYYTKK